MKYVLILALLIGLRTANGDWVNDLSGVLTTNGLSEGTAIGTIVGTLQYSSPLRVTYSTTSTYFDVQSDTGVVTLKMQLVYLTFKSITVEFIAVTNEQVFRRSVIVKINPINHAPSFDYSFYRVQIVNNTAIGTLVYSSILVTDSDEGSNGSVSVQCDRTADASQTCDFFTVSTARDQNSTYRVTVTLAKTLDPNRMNYTLSLKATDAGNPPLSSSATLQIDSVLDSRPVILDTPIIAQINEFALLASTLIVVRVRDGRSSAAGNSLTFDIADDTRGWFRMGIPSQNADGVYNVPILVAQNISLIQNSGIQRYIFTFRAHQLVNNLENQVVGYANITANIRDINDNTPTFNQSNYNANVSEGLSNGATISGLSIFVYDNDLGDNAYFELTISSSPSPVLDIFGLVPTSVQGMAAVAVVVNKPEYVRVDNFLPRNYLLTITARETKTQERRSSSTTVSIQIVSNINHPPYFPNIVNPIVVLDNTAVGSTISRYIQAVDDDTGPNGILSYSLGNDSLANTYFAINNQTGYLTLKSSLNYTIRSNFTFVVIATDGGGLTASLTIRINVVDSRKLGPQFSRDFYLSNVTELMTDLFPPITIKATLEMRNDRVMSYELLTRLSPQIFRVDPNSGVLTMLQGVDYNDTPNKQGYFDLDVQASVVGYPEIPTTIVTCRIYILDTNNHAPYFVPPNQTLSTTIKDNTPPSTQIFHLNATDDDIGINAQIDYFIQSGAQSNFVIDSFTGSLSVSASPRLVPDTTYNITVIAVDRGRPSLTGTTMVYVTIIDSISRNPTFPFVEYTFYVVEGSVFGLLVGTARATSLDRRAVISYSFVQDSWRVFNNSDVPVNVNDWFSVDSLTAEIKVQGNVVYSQATKVTVMLRANVTNRDPPVTSDLVTTVPVTINILPRGENTDVVRLSPSTDFIYIQIYEQQQVGATIFQFNAFYYATSNPINDYTFYNQSANGDYLSLERTTGLLRIAKLIRYLDIAPNTNLTYYLLAKAPSPSQAQAGVRVVVNVLPLSGYYPFFNQSSYNFTIYSNDLPGRFIGQIYAIKPPVNDPVMYALVGFNNDFQVTQNGSLILLTKINDLSSPRLSYVLLVSASLTNFSTTRAMVYIGVIPVREKAPQFTSLPYNFFVQPNFTGYVGQVLAYDPDRFNSTPIKYAIVGVTPTTDEFIINQTTGVIRLLGLPPSYNYTLNVSATDTSPTPLTNYTAVDIHVYKSSLDKPLFTNISNIYKIYNVPNVVIVKAYGTSAVPNRQLTYYVDTQMVDPSVVQHFYMDQYTGELRLVGEIPGSESKNYSLILILSDGVSNTTKEVTVEVYRNNPPTFNCKSNPIEVRVPDYSPAGTVLGNSIGIAINTLCSYNMPGTTFYYAIVDSNLTSISNIFDIVNNTGQLISKTQLNAYLLDKTLIRVSVAANATDSIEARNRPNATANVILVFVGEAIRSPTFADSDPYCPGSGLFFQAGVMDLSPTNTPVTRVQAGSCNMPGFNGVIYSIQRTEFKYYANSPEASEGRPLSDQDLSQSKNAFGIGETSGQVFTQIEDLRPFYNGWFTSLITASAQGRPDLTAVTTLRIFILREFQYFKVVFNRDAAWARNASAGFVKAVNNQLGSNYQMVPGLTTTFIDENGARNFSLSYMCYFLLQLDSTSGDYYVTSNLAEVMTRINVTQLSQTYYLLRLDDTCYSGSKRTTKWWSEKWFLWFILIAFSILVFVVALVLTCCVCFYWPMNLKEISKARPYVVFGDPAMSTAGSIADERWR